MHKPKCVALAAVLTFLYALPAEAIGIGTFSFRDEKVCHLNWEGPAVAEDFRCGKHNRQITIRQIDCIAIGGTSTDLIFRVVECDANGGSCADSGFQVELDAVATNVSDNAGTDATIDSGDWWGVDVVSLTVAPSFAHCAVRYHE